MVQKAESALVAISTFRKFRAWIVPLKLVVKLLITVLIQRKSGRSFGFVH
jgi:hypothetical protein